MRSVQTILFYEFLKQNPDLSEKVKNLAKKYKNRKDFIEKEIIKIAKKNGFDIFWQDVIEYEIENSRVVEKTNDDDLKNIAGGKMYSNLIAKGLLGVTLLAGIFGNFVNVKATNIIDTESFDTTITRSIKTGQTLKQGWVNELSNDEKNYFENLLDNKYKIIKQLGWSGARTSAYLMNDNNGDEYVLKMSNNPEDTSWIQGQKETWEKIKRVMDEWNGNVDTPTYVHFGDAFVVEKYLGEDFSPQLYETLSDEEKQNVAKNLAEFLNFLHRQNTTDKIISMLENFKKFSFSLNDCFEYMKNVISEEQYLYLNEMVEKLEKMDTSDEFKTTCHRDIRWQNVLYNKKTKKLAIIDFEIVSISNRYVDFGCTQSFGLNYKMLSNTIDEYNKISDKKINKEKAKLLCQFSIIMECCIHTKFKENKTSDEHIKSLVYNIIFPAIATIEHGFSN